MPTDDAPTLVGGVVFAVVVNAELATPNDCATPELDVYLGSAGIGRAPPSAAARLSESRLVIASYSYNVVLLARIQLRVRC